MGKLIQGGLDDVFSKTSKSPTLASSANESQTKDLQEVNSLLF